MAKNILKRFVVLGLASTMLFSMVACNTAQTQQSTKNVALAGSVNSEASTTNQAINSGYYNPSLGDGYIPEAPEREPETNIVLAQNGISDFEIVIPTNPSASNQASAEEMQRWIKSSTGATLTIREDNGEALNESKKIISIGETSIKKSAGLSMTREEVNDRGYKIRRYGNTVCIAGYKDYGTYYGVLEFLYQQVDFEVYSHTEYYFGTYNTVYLRDWDLLDRPAFEEGDMSGYSNWNPDMALHMRYTGEGKGPLATHGISSATGWLGGDCHTLNNYCNPADFDPETGISYAGTGGLCLTKPVVLQCIIRNAKKMIAENPEAKWVNIAEEDMQSFCRGASRPDGEEGPLDDGCNCKADNAKYKPSGMLVRLINKVIDAIEEWKLDPLSDPYTVNTLKVTEEVANRIKAGTWRYQTFAYSTTINPPVNMISEGVFEPIDDTVKLHEKFAIRIAPIGQTCYAHGFDDPTCTNSYNLYNTIMGWKTLTDNFLTWNYAANMSDYCLFRPFLGGVQQQMQTWAEVGTIFNFYQANSWISIMSMYQLNTYIMGKLLWNPYGNMDYWIYDFMQKNYKDAAPAMLKYLNYMMSWYNYIDSTQSGGYHFSVFRPYFDTNLWPRSVMEKAYGYINEAFDAIAHYQTTNPGLYKNLHDRIRYERTMVVVLLIDGRTAYFPNSTQRYQELKEIVRQDIFDIGMPVGEMYRRDEHDRLETTWWNSLPA